MGGHTMRQAIAAVTLATSLGAATLSYGQAATPPAGPPAYRVLGPAPADGETPARTEAGSGTFVQIRRGDTLAEIAEEANLPLKDLRELNPGIRPRKLMPGDKIRLPPGLQHGASDAFLCPGDPRCGVD